MERKTRRIFVELLQAASKTKKVNPVRYTLAMSLLDDNGQGWVILEEVIPTLAEAFEVTTKTVKNNVYRCQKLGFGSIAKGRFYYRNQERMASLLGYPLSTRSKQKAVFFSIEDLSGSIVDVRAAFEDAVVSTLAKEDKKTVTISREKRKKLSGRSRATQRKYEKNRGIDTKSNFAILGEYSDYEHKRALYNAIPAFRFVDTLNSLNAGTHDLLVRRLPNSYTGSYETTTRTRSEQTAHSKPTVPASEIVQVFYDSVKAVDPSLEKDAFWPHQSDDYGVSFWHFQEAKLLN